MPENEDLSPRKSRGSSKKGCHPARLWKNSNRAKTPAGRHQFTKFPDGPEGNRDLIERGKMGHTGTRRTKLDKCLPAMNRGRGPIQIQERAPHRTDWRCLRTESCGKKGAKRGGLQPPRLWTKKKNGAKGKGPTGRGAFWLKKTAGLVLRERA